VRRHCEERSDEAIQGQRGASKAFQTAGADDPNVVAAAVLAALFAHRPKPRVIVGKCTFPLRLLARLPIRVRDRLVKRALGLAGFLAPQSSRGTSLPA
jgi:hypothetical protein